MTNETTPKKCEQNQSNELITLEMREQVCRIKLLLDEYAGRLQDLIYNLNDIGEAIFRAQRPPIAYLRTTYSTFGMKQERENGQTDLHGLRIRRLQDEVRRYQPRRQHTLSGGTTMERVRADAKLEKSSRRTHAELIQTQKIADLYKEVCTFLDHVERTWQAAERVQSVLEKYDREACRLPKLGVFDPE